MRRVIPLFLWYPLTIIALVLTIFFYYSLTPETQPKKTPQVAGAYDNILNQSSMTLAVFAKTEQIPILPPIESSLIAADARPKIIQTFLEKHQCPMEPTENYAKRYVAIADKYNLDFRLIPAISMQESNCCKKIPGGSNNCWGYGIYGDQVVVFNSYEAGIETVAETLARNYTSKGLMEPDEIMRKYTPQSKGSWAAGVLHFMYEMK